MHISKLFHLCIKLINFVYLIVRFSLSIYLSLFYGQFVLIKILCDSTLNYWPYNKSLFVRANSCIKNLNLFKDSVSQNKKYNFLHHRMPFPDQEAWSLIFVFCLELSNYREEYEDKINDYLAWQHYFFLL